jgi:type IV pilus assembly protein PilQ
MKNITFVFLLLLGSYGFCVTQELQPVYPMSELSQNYPGSISAITDADSYSAVKPRAEDSINVRPDNLALPVNQGTAAILGPVIPDAIPDPFEEKINIDFPNAPIRDILRTVAEMYEMNIVIPESVQGNASLKLRDVTWQQVFSVLLDPIGFTYVQDANIIKIKNIKDIQNEPVSMRVFFVSYASAEDMMESIHPLVDPVVGGRVQVDKRTNAILVTERPTRIYDIETIIKQLDKPNLQVSIESKFIEVTGSTVDLLGVNWTSLGNTTNPSVAVGGSGGLGPGSGANSAFTWTNGVPTNLTSLVFSAMQFNWLINALETQTDTRLVNNPTVMTMNNVEALVSISDRYPIPKYAYNQETGTFVVNGFDYEDIGVKLKVTPQVNVIGYIKLDIRPEVSSTTKSYSFNGNEMPIISSRRTESIVTLKDGYTLAIGGLVSQNKKDVTTSVPFLGSIPILGYLFKNDNDTLTTGNLIIFLTARTVNPDGTGIEDIMDPLMMHQMGLTEADMPGFYNRLTPQQRTQLTQMNTARTQANQTAFDQRVSEQIMVMQKAIYNTPMTENLASDGLFIPPHDPWGAATMEHPDLMNVQSGMNEGVLDLSDQPLPLSVEKHVETVATSATTTTSASSSLMFPNNRLGPR